MTTTLSKIIPEESPVGESQANGEVEQAINRTKALVRTRRLSLQSRYNTVIKGDHNIVPWMIREAGKA